MSIVTLGVADVARSQAFYEGLGWKTAMSADDGLRVFSTSGAWLALYPREKLAEDAGASLSAGGFRDIALALNLGDETAVDEAIAAAVASGGKVTRPARKMEWGGYSGYVSDPDGHAWEIAFNPFWPLGPDGRPQIS